MIYHIQAHLYRMMCMSKKYTELGTFVLDTHNPDRMISISTVGTFNLRFNKNFTFPYLHFFEAPFNPWLGTITMRDIE